MTSISSSLISILLLITPLVIGPNNQAAAAVCPNVSPCSCFEEGSFLPVSVTCDKVPIDEVKAVFDRVALFDMATFTLILPSSATAFIPAGIIGYNRVSNIEIKGDDTLNPFYTVVDIDPKAFTGAERILARFYMYYLDHGQLNLNFLTGFYVLTDLRIENSTNLKSLVTLPPNLNLKNLYAVTTTGLKEVFQSPIDPLVCYGLEFLVVQDSLMDVNSMNNLLEWVLPCSRSTLVSLAFGSNEIETFPNKVISFEKLLYLKVQYNRVDMTMGENSLNITFLGSDCYLTMDSTGIVSIEPGAFQGDYRACSLNLRSNSLTRFEEGVFRNILQDLYYYDRTFGDVDVTLNPFDCYSDSCHLAWLLRDNRQLLRGFRYGMPTCADGTYFDQLSPSLFVDCP